MSASSKSPSVYASSDDEQENLLTKTKVKKSRIIDSDSDNEEDTVKEKSTFKMSDSEKSDTEDLDQRTESFSKKKKIVKRALLDSSDEDSDNEVESNEDVSEAKHLTPKTQNSQKRFGILDSSDIDQDSDTDIRVRGESSDSGEDSGSVSEQSDADISKIQFSVNKKAEKQTKKENRQSRKAKDTAMKEIASESQRMLRESKVGLPYHKPRPRTLDEFLNRKKNAPNMDISDIKKLPSLALNTEDVQAAENLLAERERIAIEFFKTNDSESEDVENDDDNKMNEVEENLNIEEVSKEIVPSLDTQDTFPLQEIDNEEISPTIESCVEAVKRLNNDECEKPTNEPEKHEESQEKPLQFQNEEIAERSEDEDYSLKLFLEPDTETMSATNLQVQADQEPAFQSNSIAALKDSLAKQPKVGLKKCTSGIVLDEIVTVGEKSVGLETLKDRFVKHVSARSHHLASRKPAEEVVSILKKEIGPDGVIRVIKEKITFGDGQKDSKDKKLNFHLVKQAQKSEKPGAQQEALKLTLIEQIRNEKRKDREIRELTRKVDEEHESDSENAEDEDDPLDDERFDEEEDTDDEEVDDDEELEESDGDEESDSNTQRNRIKCAFLDDEAEEDEPDHHFTEICSPKRHNSILGILNEDSSSLINFSQELSPVIEKFQKENKSPESKRGARKKLGFESLFDTTDPNPENLDEIIDLCSGQFMTQSQAVNTQSQDDAIEAQTPDTLVLTNSLTQTQSIFSSNKTQTKLSAQQLEEAQQLSTRSEEVSSSFFRSILESSDSEGETTSQLKSEKPKTYRRKPRIVLSDDESSSEAPNNENIIEDDEKEDEENKREVMYDSEENEIEDIQEDTKFKGFLSKDRKIRGEFLENEAELSGSEFDSEDEDETDLDRLMLEEGDYDEVDEEALRDEVGRIHQRQLLDEDQREIRLFQEAFLEDGELHSDNARQRKFKWKNLDDTDTDHTNRLTQFGDIENDEEEDGVTESWRLEKAERDKWIEESLSKSSFDTSEVSNEVSNSHDDSQFFNLASKALKKIELKPISHPSSKSFCKIFKSPKAKLPLKVLSSNAKGSFLSRDSSTLDKIAEMTKGTSSIKTGSVAKSSRNFAFAVLSPPKQSDKAQETEKEMRKKSKKNLPAPQAKRTKIDRTLDENSSDTIFSSI